MDGEGMYFWKDGRKYVGDWKNGIKEGKGILYYNNGDRYEVMKVIGKMIIEKETE